MAREPGEAVERAPSEDEARDRYLGIMKTRKRGGRVPPQFKKKKAPPFESKVEGGNARHRADRKAFKRGGKVESLADAEPSSNEQRHVPPGGAAAKDQKFQRGGRVPMPRPRRPSDEELGEAAGSAEGLQFGGRVAEHAVRSQYHGGPQRTRTTTVSSRFRDPHPVTGFKKGGVKEESAEEEAHESRKKERAEHRARGGHISTAQRKALPSSDFALPGQGKGAGGKGPGSYPIDTRNRAQNALVRGAQHASSGQLATIKRKVKAKYPDMEVS